MIKEFMKDFEESLQELSERPFTVEVKSMLIERIMSNNPPSDKGSIKCKSCNKDLQCPAIIWSISVVLGKRRKDTLQCSCLCKECLVTKINFIEEPLLEAYAEFNK